MADTTATEEAGQEHNVNQLLLFTGDGAVRVQWLAITAFWPRRAVP